MATAPGYFELFPIVVESYSPADNWYYWLGYDDTRQHFLQVLSDVGAGDQLQFTGLAPGQQAKINTFDGALVMWTCCSDGNTIASGVAVEFKALTELQLHLFAVKLVELCGKLKTLDDAYSMLKEAMREIAPIKEVPERSVQW